MLGRNIVGPCVRQEPQLAGEGAFREFALFFAHSVPFVDRDHQRPAAFEDESGDMGILFGDVLLSIEHEYHDIGRVDGLQCLDHGEFFYAFKDFSAATQPGGVDQRIAFVPQGEFHFDGIARCPGLVECNDPLLADQRIHQSRFPHIGSSNDGDFRLTVQGGFGLFVIDWKSCKRRFHKVANTFAMRRCYRNRFADSKLVELGTCRIRLHAFRFIDGKIDGAPGTAQLFRDPDVLRRNTFPPVDEEYDGVGFGKGGQRLARHLGKDAFLGNGLEAAGIDDHKCPVSLLPKPIVPVACQSRGCRNQCIPRSRETIEQRGFAHIGSSDQYQDRLHRFRSGSGNETCKSCDIKSGLQNDGIKPAVLCLHQHSFG